MDKALLKELKKESNKLKAEFNLGRNGITQTFTDTISKYLIAHQIVKIKCLTAKDKAEVEKFSDEVAKKTKSIVLVKKGYTFTLYKKEEPKVIEEN